LDELTGDLLSVQFLFGCAMASAEVGTQICCPAVLLEPIAFDAGLWLFRSRFFCEGLSLRFSLSVWACLSDVPDHFGVVYFDEHSRPQTLQE
jgi:hypothetical protein